MGGSRYITAYLGRLIRFTPIALVIMNRCFGDYRNGGKTDMCGITGFMSAAGFDSVSTNAILVNMRDSLLHRGPDDAGCWLDAEAGIALGHRRLSILDPTPAGHQPMVSESGRYVLAFNGEIYNHMDIRHQLIRTGKVAWRGHSDTESLLAAIECWGLERTLKASVGMFALAVWDRQQKILLLARDRIGEKPLYYGWQGESILFGSELKSLRKHPDFCGEMNRDVLHLYLQNGYIPSPYSIYCGIYKLPPGTIVKLSSQAPRGKLSDPIPYWSLQQVITQGAFNRFTGDELQAIDGLEACLSRAVKEQCVSDVPLGAFLSGGVDSSTIVALMQANSSKRIKTFTVGFNEDQCNEAAYAKAVASHLGTDHTEIYISPADAMSVIPNLPSMYDEPFGDSSQIPSFLISRVAREQVSVALSGDGGDELFGGYERYPHTCELNSTFSRVPRLARSLIGTGLGMLPEASLDFTLGCLFAGKGAPSVGARVKMFSQLMLADSDEQFYQAKMSQWKMPFDVLVNEHNPEVIKNRTFKRLIEGGIYERMMYVDTMSYLPDDILVKMDRAGMANSLETRMPMLDHRLVEFAWSLPLSYKTSPVQSKWLLRQVLFRHVPRKLIERPKVGFAIPVDTWIKGPLRDWAEELLSEHCLRQGGIFNPIPIRRRWNDHISGRYDSHGILWPILMFQAWLKDQR